MTTEEGCLETRDEATNTRLEEIRRIFSLFDDTLCPCEHCVAGRELLAVVDALVAGAYGDRTVEQAARDIRALPAHLLYGEKEKEYHYRLADALDRLR